MPELFAAAVHDDYYKDPVERVWAFSEAINQELNALLMARGAYFGDQADERLQAGGFEKGGVSTALTRFA